MVVVGDDEGERVDQSPTVQFQNNLSMTFKCAEQSNLRKVVTSADAHRL